MQDWHAACDTGISGAEHEFDWVQARPAVKYGIPQRKDIKGESGTHEKWRGVYRGSV